jgi:poly-beta-1,6-N-acetyl-D-glucosamine synthase
MSFRALAFFPIMLKQPTHRPATPPPRRDHHADFEPRVVQVADAMATRPASNTDQPVAARAGRRPYLSVRTKFTIALLVSIAWTALSTLLSLPWLQDLAGLAGWPVALFIVGGIAILPGMMNAFLVTGLLLDRRPPRKALVDHPGISILVAAYNEESSIADTLLSIANARYPGEFEVLVIDDGSKDATAAVVEANPYPWLRLLRQPRNMGKSAALNRGLAEARYDYIVTLDADSYLYRDALERLVERYFSDPASTRAVAGTMLVRNSRKNWITRAQEWDYFHGISAIKRVQSLFQGTLVAQGAFSIYDREALREVDGWQHCVGEDIVLTWAMLERGWRVGHAEDACCFTNVPDTLRQFVRQRQRWSRGMMEAFRQHPRVLVAPRMSTLFVWWNVLFPWLDLAYTFFFIPGVVLAFFGIFWIAGPLTLVLLPMALVMNYVMYRIGRRMFASQGLRVRKNPVGFLLYAFAYSLILQPASVAGHFSEFLGLRKTWGSK